MASRTFEILLAEDSTVDADLVRMALKEHHVPCSLHVIRDGATAIELINGLDSDPAMPALDLCLVDMHLPRRSGEDILKCLRSTQRCARTPVIVMSGISAPNIEDTVAGESFLTFFQKPSSLEEYLRLGSIVQNLLRERNEAA